MKNRDLIIAVFAAFVMMLFTATIQAQSGVATLTSEGVIQIESTMSNQTAYSIDASVFQFESEQDAINYFNDKQSDLVTYRPVYHQGIVMVYLQKQLRPDWTVSDWNTYFSENKLVHVASESINQPSK